MFKRLDVRLPPGRLPRQLAVQQAGLWDEVAVE